VNHEDAAKGAAKDWRPHLSPQFIFDSEAICSKRTSGGQIVTMMQTGKPWSRYDSTVCIRGPGSFTARWRFLCRRKMHSLLVVVTDVLIHQAFQMPFVHYHRMVEHISAAVTDPVLGNTVLHGLRKLVGLGWVAKLFNVSITSSLKFVPRSKIR